MISRSTLIAALVVVELAILGLAANALTGGNILSGPAPASISFALPNPGNPGNVASPLDRTFVTGPTPHVRIDVPGIPVTVEAGNGLSVRVIETLTRHGFISGKPVPLGAEQTADGVRVHAIGDGAVFVIMGSYEHSLRVIVPATAQVELATGDRIDVSGMRAKLVAHTSDGSLHVRDHQGDLDVSTDDGRIELTDVQGAAIDANDRDGRIYLTRVGAERLVAHSDSGRIVGTGVRAVNGGLTTNDGRIVVSFTATSDAIATVHTDDGTVHVSGLSSQDLGADRRIVTLGAGRGHFEISTGDGPITITQGANG